MSLPRSVWTSLTKGWHQETILSAFLLFLVIRALVLPAVITVSVPGRILADIFFSLILITGVATLARRRWVFYAMVAVCVTTFLVYWLSWFVQPAATNLVREWASLFTLVAFAVVVLTRVLSTGEVTRARIEGAVAAYLLLGLSWASAYQLVEMYNPQAFQGFLGDTVSGLGFSYFSFVTLTSTGYGDITPVHPLARSLSVTEALTGQLYIAILLARLVSMQIQSRQR